MITSSPACHCTLNVGPTSQTQTLARDFGRLTDGEFDRDSRTCSRAVGELAVLGCTADGLVMRGRTGPTLIALGVPKVA